VVGLTFHHSVGDARSGIELLRNVLSRVATGATNRTRLARILPPMHTVFPEQFLNDAADRVRSAMVRDLMVSQRRHGRPAAIPWLNQMSQRRVPRVLRTVLEPDDLRRLSDGCHSHNVTVHGALCAAQLLAIRRLLSQQERAALFLSCPIDLRPHLTPPQPTSPTNLFVTVVAGSFALERSADFWLLAAEVTARIRQQVARGDGFLFFSAYEMGGVFSQPDGVERFRRMVTDLPQGSSLSNAGRVSLIEADPAVDSISFALCPAPGQCLSTTANTYGDRLVLNFGYDAGKQDDSSARACADAIRETLLEPAAG
jgi:NRPS condensation-like uncharacterized protein